MAWITLGDPLTYSTFSAVARLVVQRRPGTQVTQVPGIMAFQALAARTGTVIAGERTRISIRTALDGDDIAADLRDPATTLIVYKGGRRLPELAARRPDAGPRPNSASSAPTSAPVAGGSSLGMPGERVGLLADVAAAGPASYLATVIIPATTGKAPLSGVKGR